MQPACHARLPDGKRLHLQHGPIDLIIKIDGPGRRDAERAIVARFETVLQELVDELSLLRQPVSMKTVFEGPVAVRMQAATLRFRPDFITPMAAVAGSVADEMIAVIAACPGVEKAWVNNGGDTAFYLSPSTQVTARIAAAVSGEIQIRAQDPYRGVATSGWRGRSHSLGIADSVSVVAETAADADAAATMIANRVDLPGHPGITREPACQLSPDSDLGDRLVTVDVGALRPDEVSAALDAGGGYADSLVNRGLIGGAVVGLKNSYRHVGSIPLLSSPTELEYAHA